MPFFQRWDMEDLPIKYSEIPFHERWRIREMYYMKQKGLCYHCHSPVDAPVPDFILEKRIDWDLFPKGFQKYPVHLHHDHNTDMTIGIVHMYCNAVLWQYHGE